MGTDRAAVRHGLAEAIATERVSAVNNHRLDLHDRLAHVALHDPARGTTPKEPPESPLSSAHGCAGALVAISRSPALVGHHRPSACSFSGKKKKGATGVSCASSDRRRRLQPARPALPPHGTRRPFCAVRAAHCAHRVACTGGAWRVRSGSRTRRREQNARTPPPFCLILRHAPRNSFNLMCVIFLCFWKGRRAGTFDRFKSLRK